MRTDTTDDELIELAVKTGQSLDQLVRLRRDKQAQLRRKLCAQVAEVAQVNVIESEAKLLHEAGHLGDSRLLPPLLPVRHRILLDAADSAHLGLAEVERFADVLDPATNGFGAVRQVL